MMKSFYGDHAQADNLWGYEWLPKWDRSYDVMVQTELMVEGKMHGYIVQGFNPLAAFSNKNKATEALSKLKYMVVIDPLATETSTFWQNHGEFNDVDSASIQTEVFRLLRGRQRLHRQLRPLVAMALGSGRATGRGAARREDPRQTADAPARTVSRRRRRMP